MHADDWSDYQAFLAIARAGQLARAGAALGVDATTAGRRLRRLEARLGLTLFEQTREGQVLTEAGENLLVAVEAMAAAAAGIGEAAHPGEGLSGTLRVSVSEGFGSAFLAPRIGEFAARHPALTLDLVASSGFLSPSRHEADIAVMLSRPRTGPVVARKLSDYALRLYASRAYIDRHGAPEREAVLASGHRLVGYIPDLIYAPELRYLDEIHPGLAATLRSPSIVAQQRLVASGAGIGVLPCFMAEGDARLMPVIPQRRILRSFWLVTHKDTRRLARVRAAMDWLIETTANNRAVLVPPV
ncbi:LysR family transcriptional regulator [Novosphingobium sp. ZN18A2]|uniref:LysR family transcriptional regulator n=1 Tax=Novosphingobium sp. ZN18A2 TaxID=3079861 RepID=UPI0030D1E5B3